MTLPKWNPSDRTVGTSVIPSFAIPARGFVLREGSKRREDIYTNQLRYKMVLSLKSFEVIICLEILIVSRLCSEYCLFLGWE